MVLVVPPAGGAVGPAGPAGPAGAGAAALFTSSGGVVGNTGAGLQTLKTYTMPANTMTVDGDSVRVTAWGQCGIGAKSTSIRLVFGTVDIVASFVTTVASNWRLEAYIKRLGPASETAITEVDHSDAYQPPQLVGFPSADLTAPVQIRIDGENLTDAVNNAVTCFGMDVELVKV